MNSPDSSAFEAGTPMLVSSGFTSARPVLAVVAVDASATGTPAAAHSPAPTANEYVATLFVFMLATFIGFDVIRNVSRLLHTPLMSLTNAISAIAVVGSVIIAGEQKTTFSTVLGTIAVAASVTNIVSGFLITDRMLRMFKKREPAK